MTGLKIAYVELPAGEVEGMKSFYQQSMGWEFEDWGPEYAAMLNAGVDGGLNGAAGQRTRSVLVLVETDDLEKAHADVLAAGGKVIVPIFSYPGGRRFHFTDPAGNELGVFQVE